MKPAFKPFRLLNSKEHSYLQQQLDTALTDWNRLYAGQAIKLELGCATNLNHSLLLVKQAGKPLALVDEHYLYLIKEAVFSEHSTCFDPVCTDLFMQLLKQLLALDSLELSDNNTQHTEWFYQGSPCLGLRLGHETQHFNLYLHPSWVLAHLPKEDRLSKPLARLEKALANIKLQLTVELEPLVLSLEKLSQLQIGDIIKTSHSLGKPLSLNYQQQLVSEVTPGQQRLQRSIQLRNNYDY